MMTPPVGKSGPLMNWTDLVQLGLRMVDHIADAVDHLGQVMRRDVGRHADRDARRAVYQKVGKRERGSTKRLLPLLVEVRAEIHCVFLISASI